ncbi:HAD family hydrolase [Clostridioides difficile]
MGIFDGYLLVSDMDGTLLNSKGKLSEENKRAIEYFVDNGGEFTLATGRMLPSIKRHIHKMKVTLPVIMYNGTKVYDFKNDQVVWETFLEEERKEIVKVVNEINKNVGIEIYSDETVYIYQSCSRTERFSKLGYDVIYNVDDSIWNKKWTKVLIVGEKEEVDCVEEYLKDSYEDNYIVRSSEVYLEVIPKNISKGQALKELMTHKNMEGFTVISVGDNMNDVELLEEAHYGFCIKNGSEELKKKSKYIAPSNDENPIEFIVKWIEEANLTQ